ncbi:hypothetical protein [Crocosphaera sp.]|nr:hypothetical protein [Crocosphaera sp.]
MQVKPLSAPSLRLLSVYSLSFLCLFASKLPQLFPVFSDRRD